MTSGASIYVIDKIVDSRKPEGVVGAAREYLVQWRGWPGQDTWEPYEHIAGRGDDVITQFLARQVTTGRAGQNKSGRGRKRKPEE